MAKHSLIRVKGSLVNTPHLIEQNSFNTILEYVNSRIQGDVDITRQTLKDEDETDYNRIYRYDSQMKLGIMSIDGPLTYRTSGWEAMCGGTSYEMLKDQMEYFVQSGAKTVAMLVSSGGGEAYALFDTANYLRTLASENGIKIVSYIDGMSASAAYGLTAISDEIISSSGSMTGSIGVLIQLLNNSKALEKEGYERTFVSAGSEKIPYDKDGSFREGFLEDLQHQVDALYEDFTYHIASYRGLPQDAVKNTEARNYMANEALELGLIDQIMTVESFYTYLADFAQSNLEGNEMGNPLKNLINMKTKEDKAEMSQLTELQALLETKEAELSASLDQLVTMTASMAELQDKLQSLQAFAEAQELAAEAAKAEATRIAEEQAQAKLDQRKAALSEVVAEDQLEATFGALASLDDTSFELIVSQYASTKAARAESFKALGNEGIEQEHTAAEQGSVDAIRQAGVQKARERYAK